MNTSSWCGGGCGAINAIYNAGRYIRGCYLGWIEIQGLVWSLGR